jgi:hypothetical protein
MKTKPPFSFHLTRSQSVAMLLILLQTALASHSLAQPVITIQPARQTNVVGTTATLCVTDYASHRSCVQRQSTTLL